MPPCRYGAALLFTALAPIGGDGLRLKQASPNVWEFLGLQHGEPEKPNQKTFRSYVINMDHRTDRLDNFAEKLGALHPWLKEKTCRVPAVNGGGLTEADLTEGGWAFGLAETEALKAAKENVQFYKTNAWPHMTPGGLGLVLSHARAWRSLVESGEEVGVVFEDDLLQYSDDFKEQFDKLLSRGSCPQETPEERAAAYALGHTPNTERDCVPESWDIVQLQSCWNTNGWLRRSDLADFYVPEFLQGTMTKREERPTKVVPTVLRCTGAYAITREAAKKALAQFIPVKKGMMQLDNVFGTAPGWGGEQLLDNVLATDKGYRLYAFYPIIAQVDSLNKDGKTDSDVQGVGVHRLFEVKRADYKPPLPTCQGME